MDGEAGGRLTAIAVGVTGIAQEVEEILAALEKCRWVPCVLPPMGRNDRGGE